MSEFVLDKKFLPAYDEFKSFQKEGTKEIVVTAKRKDNIVYPFRMMISDDYEKSYFFAKKMILSLMWIVGAESFCYKGDKEFYSYLINRVYDDLETKKSFEAMKESFGSDVLITLDDKDYEVIQSKTTFTGSFDGNRIGIDLGGSDRKVTAISDGKVVFSDETLWTPKPETDYKYHVEGILDSLNKAASVLKRVDSVGVSTAGMVFDDELIYPALFESVPLETKQSKIRTLIPDIVKDRFGDIPFAIANDGDVSAIGASIMFKKDNVLGLALGTSFAAGYAKNGFLLNWANELSKVSIDYNPEARAHYILNIQGSSSEYLSQKGIVRLLENNGVQLEGETLPKKLVSIQKMAEEGNKIVLDAYHDMGIYLGSAIMFFTMFYKIDSVMLLGRVLTGKGGEILTNTASSYLKERGVNIEVFTCDENFKRLGQSYIAASMPRIK